MDSLQMPVVASAPGSSRLSHLVSFALHETGRTSEMEVDMLTCSSDMAEAVADASDIDDGFIHMGGLDLDAPESREDDELPTPLYRQSYATMHKPQPRVARYHP